MIELIFSELERCEELCTKLEQLFQQDTDEIALSVTGEIYDAYINSATEVMQSVVELKRNIMLLRGCESWLM